MRDTIFALATAPGRAAVAVVRISGPGAGDAIDRLAGRRPLPRLAALRQLRDPATSEAVDQALVLWFPGPGSFTGEDVVELHLHGGRAVISSTLEHLAALGLRPAEPGEFTRRAFEAGRLELSQAEAIADLIDAETEAQRRQALAQLGGALARRYESWRGALIEVLALFEAEIDFPDEELPGGLAEMARAPLMRLLDDITAALRDTRGERVRDGFRIALIGGPNAGKSSLYNALVGRNAAIVTPTPGTTRDVLEATLDIAGFPVLLADMAGVRRAEDPVEAEGVRRARNWSSEADLRLWVVDRSGDAGVWAEASELLRPGDILLLNKRDLPAGTDAAAVAHHAQGADLEIVELTATAAGDIDRLTQTLRSRVIEAVGGQDIPAVTQLRHRRLLEEALAHIDRALAELTLGAELAAENVRLAARAMERISGRIDADAVLDRVFASFCIGK
ncbi:MAG: tRNA uridine-5-carboxymethylaminomethyl(34) synthesis GTPase MnmE [Caulobacteraceae bacterium]